MVIHTNRDNGSICIRKSKKPGYYIGDTIGDYDIIKALGFPYSLSEQDVDNLIAEASRWGFDIKEYL